jgi:phosphohistidine phosphatase
MNLYLLRHGLAVDRSKPGYKKDADRPLTPKGKQRLWRVAEAMEEMELEFDAIITSPFLRAAQTAEIVAEAFELRKKLSSTEHLTPNGNPKLLLEHIIQIKPAPKDVLLVGHEPYLGQLIGLLVAGNTNALIDLKKGALCKLEIENLRCGRCATLAWLLTPKQMVLMV